MTIETEIKDINGASISLGDTVLAYAQKYEEVARDESGGVPVIEVDTSRPKPIEDVPLFKGCVVWDSEQMALQIRIQQMLVRWEAAPATVRMSGYVYERLNASGQVAASEQR